MEDIFLRQCRKSRCRNQAKYNGGGVRFSNPFIAFYEGRIIRDFQLSEVTLKAADMKGFQRNYLG